MYTFNKESVTHIRSTYTANPLYIECTHELMQEAENLLVKVLPAELSAAKVELMPYLLDSFGNPIRIDYGSGHELAFVAFLCCCTLIGMFTAEDFKALVVVVFDKYLKLVRKIQTRYQQEPAGSHGYCIVHGVWGACQDRTLPFRTREIHVAFILWMRNTVIGNARNCKRGCVRVRVFACVRARMRSPEQGIVW